MWCVAVGVPVTVVGKRVGGLEAHVVDQVAGTDELVVGGGAFRQALEREPHLGHAVRHQIRARVRLPGVEVAVRVRVCGDSCLLYTSDAADE